MKVRHRQENECDKQRNINTQKGGKREREKSEKHSITIKTRYHKERYREGLVAKK